MKLTKSQLREIIREELSERRNPLPPRSSNWYKFAKAFDIGILDLEEVGSYFDYKDFYDLDISISPRSLFQRHRRTFIQALQNSSTKAQNMNDKDIVATIKKSGP